MSSSFTSFAGVVSKHSHEHGSRSASDARDAISVEEWLRRREVNERHAQVACTNSTNSAAVIGVPVDILDCDFIDFHRELKEFAMDTFGLMQDSEAAHLHDAICRFVRMNESAA